MRGSRLAVSYEKCLFNFLEIAKLLYKVGFTTLRAHQQCMRVPFVPHPPQHLVWSVFLILDILSCG